MGGSFKKSKSDILLEVLDKNELKSFDGFISFSLRGKSPGVLEYWNYKYSLINGKPFDNHPVFFSRKILSDFNCHLKRYLILKCLEKDTYGSKVFLSRELRRRKINKYFEQLLDDIKEIKNTKIKMWWF